MRPSRWWRVVLRGVARSKLLGGFCGLVMTLSLVAVGAELGAEAGHGLIIGEWAVDHVVWPLITMLLGAIGWLLVQAVRQVMALRRDLDALTTTHATEVAAIWHVLRRREDDRQHGEG